MEISLSSIFLRSSHHVLIDHALKKRFFCLLSQHLKLLEIIIEKKWASKGKKMRLLTFDAEKNRTHIWWWLFNSMTSTNLMTGGQNLCFFYERLSVIIMQTYESIFALSFVNSFPIFFSSLEKLQQFEL